MKEYEATGHTTQENTEQSETGPTSSWASKFLGLPSKMGGWVTGKKPNADADPISNSETRDYPLPIQDTSSPSPPSPIVVSSSEPYEISEDDDEPSYMDLINDNEIGGMAEAMNMVYPINDYKRNTVNGDENVNEEKEDDQKEEEVKKQLADQSDSVSTDSFTSTYSPPANPNVDFTLVNIKQEPLDEDDVTEVDAKGKKVKVVKVPVLELEDLRQCKKKLEALTSMKTSVEQTSGTLQQALHNAPVQNSTPEAAVSRRNPSRSAKNSTDKKSVKTEKNVKAGKSKKKSEVKETKQRRTKKTRASSSSKTAKEEKAKVDELFCPECRRTFSTKSGLRNHQLSHKTSNGQFKCNTCGKDLFKTGHHLRQHEACHFPAETCEHCGKKFGTRSNLANHQRTSKACKAIRQNGTGHG